LRRKITYLLKQKPSNGHIAEYRKIHYLHFFM